MKDKPDMLICLDARERQVAELSERLRRVDVGATIRSSILNCVSSNDLLSEFSGLENADSVDGLTAIVDRLVSVGVQLTNVQDIDKALKVFKFLFKYSFSAVPTRIESLSHNTGKEFENMQDKLKRIRDLKLAGAIDVEARDDSD